MSFGYNACEAIRMELGSLPLVRTAVLGMDKVDALEMPGSQTWAGQLVGGSVRGLARIVQSIPGTTLLLDTVKRSYSLDVLSGELKADPRNPRLLVQTAEAQVRVAQLYRLIRLARMVDPTSAATSELLRLAASMGMKRDLPGRRLAAAAYRITLDGIDGQPDFRQHLVMARALRILGKPGAAAQHAKQASQRAERDFQASGFSWEKMGFWDRLATSTIRGMERFDARVNGVSEHSWREGEPLGLDAQERLRLRRGSAMMTWALANLDAGRTEQAVSLAEKAAGPVGLTCAREVIAASRPPGPDLGAGIEGRLNDMAGIAALDRNYYYGHWNGSLRIAGGVVAMQFDKIGRWFQ